MSYEAYQTVWYLLVGILLTGYAVLDGFDLGVGALHLFARGDRASWTKWRDGYRPSMGREREPWRRSLSRRS